MQQKQQNIRVKICGLSTPEAVLCAANAGADMLGFVFCKKSPRHLDFKTTKKLAEIIPAETKAVAVVVDPADTLLRDIMAALKPDYIQLHGSETPVRVAKIKALFDVEVIKAVSIESAADLETIEEYQTIADYILLDAKPPKDSKIAGGNAVAFDWALLADYELSDNIIIAGGLNKDNIQQAIAETGTSFFDVSSGVESSAGKKDCSMIEAFVKALREGAVNHAKNGL